jgi:hypothetical protein
MRAPRVRAAGARPARARDPFKAPRHGVSRDGFSLHAGVRIHANDRHGLERLCGYAVRPPFALQRSLRHGSLIEKRSR